MDLHVPVLPFQRFVTTAHPSHMNRAVIVGGTGTRVGNSVPEPAPPSSGTDTLLASNSGEK